MATPEITPMTPVISIPLSGKIVYLMPANIVQK